MTSVFCIIYQMATFLRTMWCLSEKGRNRMIFCSHNCEVQWLVLILLNYWFFFSWKHISTGPSLWGSCNGGQISRSFQDGRRNWAGPNPYQVVIIGFILCFSEGKKLPPLWLFVLWEAGMTWFWWPHCASLILKLCWGSIPTPRQVELTQAGYPENCSK